MSSRKNLGSKYAERVHMGKQINFLGYSLWTLPDNPASDHERPEADRESSVGGRLYSPLVLAVYCLFTSSFVGTLLYGLNLRRRGYLWKANLLIALSCLILLVSAFSAPLNQFTFAGANVIFRGLVALSLFAAEQPHFQRAQQQGQPPARTWLPLVWIGGAIALQWLIER
ncbi:MAG: hypothetical protein WBC73_13170 [Phormidesmis sp.]